jgi:cytochrome P450
MNDHADLPLNERDYYRDSEILINPYAYFEAIRADGPIFKVKGTDRVIVTGYQEGIDVLQNTEDFSAVIAPLGPIDLPFEPQGDDISDQIEEHRSDFPNANNVVTYDGEKHAIARSLLNPVFRPSRLKANEAFVTSLADRMAREMVGKGGCETQGEVATPFATLVVADLLGVPEEDHREFSEVIGRSPPPGALDRDGEPIANEAVQFMAGYFMRYIADRRANPRKDDVMTELANVKLSDGSTPDIMEVMTGALLLFAAGQDTTAKLFGTSMRILAEDPQLQGRLREDRSLIPTFVEETLRMEGSVKATHRLCKRTTTIAGVTIPAGSKVGVAVAAANRDPARWGKPHEFRLDRPKIKEHLAFGRGPHTCVGAALARTEMRIILDRFLEHSSEIRISEEHHGPVEARKFDYAPTFIFRGVNELHLEFDP